ncbi:hypothetical protein [Halorussus aquaticus]|uniref:Uncharacterized protein n=1 Tax=Halorussus aquaticus TaxID=2953748 RepID=A0ABD5Q782_9EURY|nr:hypothetical protein [Halorussus aquaticus]
MGGRETIDGAEEAIDEQVESVRGNLVQPDENWLKRWLLLGGNRILVSVVALFLVLLGFVGLGVGWTAQMTELMTETEIVQTLLFTLLSGTILLVSIAVSINSVVLSQEITSLGDQEEEIEESFSFRRGIQDYTDSDVSPSKPAEFLLAIVRAVRDHAEDLQTTVQGQDSMLERQVETFSDDVARQVGEIEERLETGQFGTSEVLMAGLDYDYSWQVYAAQRLRAEHRADLSDEQLQVLDDIDEILKQFTTGREYFKTLYFKREMANLSRYLLLVAFPTIVSISYVLLALRAQLIPNVSPLGIPSIVVFIGLAYVVGIAPFTLFTAYVLRSATIAHRTLAAGPFTLERDGKRGRIDWE